MTVVEFSERIRVEGEVTRQQLAKLAQISRRDGGCRLDSWDIACIRSVVEALKVKNPGSNGRSGRLARTEVEPKALATPPAPGPAPSRRR